MNKELEAQRESLKKEAELYQQNIKEQLNSTVDGVEKLGKKALVVGSILIAGYGIASLFSKKERTIEIQPQIEKLPQEVQIPHNRPITKPKKTPYFSRLLKEQLALLMVDIVKRTIKDYMIPTATKEINQKKQD